jgi:tetratricopeptide (TPR) repeat protein
MPLEIVLALAAFGIVGALAPSLFLRRRRRQLDVLGAQVDAMLAAGRTRALSLPPPLRGDADFVECFDDAVQRRAARDLDGARRSIARSLALNPTYYRSYLLRAGLCLAERDPRGAIADYTKGLGLLPTQITGESATRDVTEAEAEARFQRAKAYLAVGDPEAAEQDLRHALELGHPSAAGALHMLGRVRLPRPPRVPRAGADV